MGRESAVAIAGRQTDAWTRVHGAEVFFGSETGARDPASPRAGAVAGGMFQPGVDRGRTGGGTECRTNAGPVCSAGSGLEGVSFYAGAGGGGQRPRLLATGDG